MLVKQEPTSDSADQDVMTHSHGRWQREDLGRYLSMWMNLRNTHDSISSEFHDGRSFDGLVAGLEAGRIDPLVHRKCKSVEVKWPGKLGSFPSTTGGHIVCLCVRQSCGRVEVKCSSASASNSVVGWA